MIPQIQPLVEPARAPDLVAAPDNAGDDAAGSAFRTMLGADPAERTADRNSADPRKVPLSARPPPDPTTDHPRPPEPVLATAPEGEADQAAADLQIPVPALPNPAPTLPSGDTLPLTDQTAATTASPEALAFLDPMAVLPGDQSLPDATALTAVPAMLRHDPGAALTRVSPAERLPETSVPARAPFAAATPLSAGHQEGSLPVVPQDRMIAPADVQVPLTATPAADRRGTRSTEAAILLRAASQATQTEPAAAPLPSSATVLPPNPPGQPKVHLAEVASLRPAPRAALSNGAQPRPEPSEPRLAATNATRTSAAPVLEQPQAPPLQPMNDVIASGGDPSGTQDAADADTKARANPQTPTHAARSTEAAVLLRAAEQGPPPLAVDPGKLPDPSSAAFDAAMLPQAETLLAGPSSLSSASSAGVGPASSLHAATMPTPLSAATVPALVQVVSQTGTNTVDLVLTPEDLGRLRFEVTQTGEQMRIHLTVERPETLDLLRRNADQLLAEFRQAGFSGATLSFGQGGQNATGGQDQPPPAPDATPSLPPTEHANRAPTAPPSGGGLDLRL